jgi:glycosyltransferase involved in cell wall biosynthesis
MTSPEKLHIAMLVVDANEVRGLTHKDETKRSPVLHTAIHNLLEGLKIRDDVEVTVLYGRQQIIPGEDRVEGSIHYLPVPYKPLPFLGMGGPLLGRALALSRKLRSLKPDLVHGQGTERESGLVAAWSSFPSIITLHGNLGEIAKTMQAKPFSYFWLAAKLERWALPRVTMIHCISDHTRESVKESLTRTWIIPNAVAQDYFDVINQPSDNPSVVCISGIAEWKNPITLVHASDRLHEEFPEARVDFYGACNTGYPYGAAFMAEIATRPWCHFHGQSSLQTLTAALETATCAVLPSKQENFGLALAEAMAAGVLGIGSNVGGIPDVITPELTGLLFEPDNSDELSKLLVDIHRDRKRLNLLASAGRLRAVDHFSIQAVADAHLAMYQDIAISSKLHG